MKLNARYYCLAVLLLMMFAVPAFAQFEVSPDHFDDNPSSSPQADHSKSVTSLRLKIAEQKKLLAGYQGQLLQKSALVAKARQALGNSSSAAARNDYFRQKSELRELRQSLGGPVRNAQLALVRLERQQRALHAPASVRHASGTTTTALSTRK
jgi:hypothetical protein